MKDTFYDTNALPCIIQYSSHMSVNSCSNYVFIFTLVLSITLISSAHLVVYYDGSMECKYILF
jgi:hypothetical protein